MLSPQFNFRRNETKQLALSLVKSLNEMDFYPHLAPRKREATFTGAVYALGDDARQQQRQIEELEELLRTFQREVDSFQDRVRNFAKTYATVGKA